MHKGKLLNLIANALPADLPMDEIIALAPEELWEEAPDEAAIQALSSHPRINWEAYLNHYPDLKAARVDLCPHFIRNGIFENRKLISWHPLKKPEKENAPLISVIIANYNNGLYLAHCIASVSQQTLGNIEIVVIDDASTDNSVQLMLMAAKKDQRIRLLQNSKNLGTYLTRKIAANQAQGRYLLFLDSDDWLSSDACERLAEVMNAGYDIVAFAFKFIITSNYIQCSPEQLEKQFSGGEYQIYNSQEMIEQIFTKKSIRWNLCGKIFLRELVVSAFEDIPEGRYTMAEDTLSMLGIARLARTLYKIPDTLYYYNYGQGISAPEIRKSDFKRYLNLGNTIKAIGAYAAKHKLNIDFNTINRMHCHSSIWKWLTTVPDESLTYYYELLKSQYGFDTLLSLLMEYFSNLNNLVILAEKLKKCIPDTTPIRPDIQHVCLIVSRNICALQHASRMAAWLASNHLQITILGDERCFESELFPANAEVASLMPTSGMYAEMHGRMSDLTKYLKDSKFDLAIHMAEDDNCQLWDMLLLHHYLIPVIAVNLQDFSYDFMPNVDIYAKKRKTSAFSCAQSVICVSRSQEAYLRSLGINGQYLFLESTISIHKGRAPSKHLTRIGIMANPGEAAAQMEDCYQIFKVIRRQAPGLRLLIFGQPANRKVLETHRQRIKALELGESVELYPASGDISEQLTQCDVLISTAHNMSYDNGVSHARSLGIPCVTYDLPDYHRMEDQGVISFPQGDHVALSNYLSILIKNPEEWQKIQQLAAKVSTKAGQENELSSFIAHIHNFQSYSNISPYMKSDYYNLFNYSSTYALN